MNIDATESKLYTYPKAGMRDTVCLRAELPWRLSSGYRRFDRALLHPFTTFGSLSLCFRPFQASSGRFPLLLFTLIFFLAPLFLLLLVFPSVSLGLKFVPITLHAFQLHSLLGVGFFFREVWMIQHFLSGGSLCGIVAKHLLHQIHRRRREDVPECGLKAPLPAIGRLHQLKPGHLHNIGPFAPSWCSKEIVQFFKLVQF